MNNADNVTKRIIGCAMEVHRHLGPCLLESAYETALTCELETAELRYQRKVLFPAIYKGRTVGSYRLDLIVEDLVVVEVKSVERFDAVFRAQILTYLRITGKKVGLVINFNTHLLKHGIRRFILQESLWLCASVAL